MRRYGGDDEVDVAQRRFEVGGDPQPVWKLDTRKIDGVRPAHRHFLGQRRIARPETGIVTAASQMDGQRSPPSPRTKYCNLTNRPSYARCPIRRSVPAMTRARFPRWR